MAVPERQRLSTPIYTISVYDVLRGSRLTWMQLVIMAYGNLTYSQAINHTMLATLGQASLWTHWEELGKNHVIFNSVIAAQAIARLLGNIYIVPLMDFYGRRDLFLLCNAVPLVLTVGSFFAPNFTVYAIFRCLAVFTSTSGSITANVYVIELVNPKYRPTVNWTQQAYSCVGLMYMILCKYLLERNGASVWNWLQFYTHLPTLVGVVIGLATRLEGPGYLILFRADGAERAWRTIEKIVGGPEEVDRILREMPTSSIHLTEQESLLQDGSAKPAPIGEIELANIVHNPDFNDPILCNANNIVLERANVRFVEELGAPREKRSHLTFLDFRPVIRGWADLFRRPDTRWDTIGLCVVWFGEAFCHWGIMSYCTLFYESVGYDANKMMVLVWAIQIPIHYVMVSLMTWLHNERLLIGLNSAVAVVITAALAILMSLKHADIQTGPDLILAILAVSVAVVGCTAWGPLYAYSSERYPIKVRASAMGLFQGVDSIAIVGASYLGSMIIQPDTVQYMLFANTLVRLIVAIITMTLMTTDVKEQILDFCD